MVACTVNGAAVECERVNGVSGIGGFGGVAGGDPFNGSGPARPSVNVKPSVVAASLARQLPLCAGMQRWADNVSILGVSWFRDGRVTVAR